MDFRILLSVLMVYQHNFRILHWKASGSEFHTQHDWAAKYYNDLGEHIDQIAEMAMRLDQEPVNYKEAAEMLEDYKDRDFTMLENDDYDMSKFIDFTDKMFSDILYCIEELLKSSEVQDVKNSGIKSDLEGIHSCIDLQYRYINVRRK